MRNDKLTLRREYPREREAIYRLRHRVYASEFGQHPVNGEESLSDSLDGSNFYLVAEKAGEIIGFVSITPPDSGRYSLDKYLSRDEFPFQPDARTYEVRLLTVASGHRGTAVAGLLMVAALRFVEVEGGDRILAMGRREILDLYLKVGFQSSHRTLQSGAVHYEALAGDVSRLRGYLEKYRTVLPRLEPSLDWRFDFPILTGETCFHGGAFFEAIGPRFDALERRHDIINADVLDAWFDPAPAVLDALRKNLEWAIRTSPPTRCEGLREAIAATRSVPETCVLPGAGASDLIFSVFPQWLSPRSRVLLPWPTYGEYPFVLEQIVKCRVDRLFSDRSNGYDWDLPKLERKLEEGYDLVVLVNPNNPSGKYASRRELESLLNRAPQRTRFWIDEAYLEYVALGESLEPFATRHPNVVVCKSMSKVYALSGLRVAYLCGAPAVIANLSRRVRPWAVGLTGQIAAVRALQSPEYYQERYVQTRIFREELQPALQNLGLEVIPGSANFLLCHIPDSGPSTTDVIQRCRQEGLFIREWKIGSSGEKSAIRLAVKTPDVNSKMIEILRRSLN